MRSGRLTIATAGVAIGLGAMLVPAQVVGRSPDVRVLVIGLILIACGVALPMSDRARWCGVLLVAAGYAWFLPSFDVTGSDWADRAIASTSLLHIALVAGAIALVPLAGIGTGGLVVALVPAGIAAVSAAVGGYRVALFFAGIALVVVVVHAWTRGHDRTSRAALAFVAAGLVLGVELAAVALARIATAAPPERALMVAHEAALALAAALVLAAVTWSRPGAAIDLRDGGIGALEPTLARALGTPRLTVRFPDGGGAWLDPFGHRADALESPSTAVDGDDGLIAVVGMAGPIPPNLQEPLERVLRLGRDNARLRQAVTGQLDELAQSRRRLVEAGDSERLELERQLREGALGRLERICALLAAIPSARHRAELTRNELENVALGLDPLARGASLETALSAVTAGDPASVELLISEDGIDEATKRALWYACAEGLTNAWKHAPGAHVQITVGTGAGIAFATVTDAGPGGADRSGSGLRGLRDRIEALGGSLCITSRPGAGTALQVELPQDRRAVTGQPLVGARADSNGAVEIAA